MAGLDLGDLRELAIAGVSSAIASAAARRRAQAPHRRAPVRRRFPPAPARPSSKRRRALRRRGDGNIRLSWVTLAALLLRYLPNLLHLRDECESRRRQSGAAVFILAQNYPFGRADLPALGRGLLSAPQAPIFRTQPQKDSDDPHRPGHPRHPLHARTSAGKTYAYYSLAKAAGDARRRLAPALLDEGAAREPAALRGRRDRHRATISRRWSTGRRNGGSTARSSIARRAC